MSSARRRHWVITGVSTALLVGLSGCTPSAPTSSPAQPSSSSGTETAAVADYALAWSDAQPVRLPSAEGLVSDESSAYQFAREYSGALPVAGDRYGFKFGCGKASLCPFQQRIPLFGVLWAPMKLDPGATVDLATYVRGFVEGELAFRFEDDVTAPLPTIAAVKSVATSVAPAIELPDFAFGDRALDQTPNVDVTAVNGIARTLVVGDFQPTSRVPVDSIEMRGTRNGRTVLTGGSRDVTDGSHWEALQLAVELILSHGYTVEAGDVIITGTMGEPTPLRPGRYSVGYGKQLGAISFMAQR